MLWRKQFHCVVEKKGLPLLYSLSRACKNWRSWDIQSIYWLVYVFDFNFFYYFFSHVSFFFLYVVPLLTYLNYFFLVWGREGVGGGKNRGRWKIVFYFVWKNIIILVELYNNSSRPEKAVLAFPPWPASWWSTKQINDWTNEEWRKSRVAVSPEWG